MNSIKGRSQLSQSHKKKNPLGIEKLKITTGRYVEVRIDEPGYELSWWPGKIVGSLTGGKCTIEYETLTTDDGKDRLREEKDVELIRPKPKELYMINRFVKNDIVDAYFNEGWWEGCIVRVLADSRYKVYFDKFSEVLDFTDDQLRVHQEWFNGAWKAGTSKEVVDIKTEQG